MKHTRKKSPLKPDAALLVKLGSIAVHVEEYFSPDGHPLDKTTIDSLLADPEVKNWIGEMTRMAMLPVKRVEKARNEKSNAR